MNSTFSLKALAVGFLAGALAVPVFHQGMVLLLHLAGQVPNFPWQMRPVPPFNVPTLVNQMFWGGVWGLVFAAIVETLPGRSLWLKGVLFGLLGPWLLGNGLLVPLIKGGPLFFGFAVPRMITGALIGAAFGFGLAVIYGLLRPPARRARPGPQLLNAALRAAGASVRRPSDVTKTPASPSAPARSKIGRAAA